MLNALVGWLQAENYNFIQDETRDRQPLIFVHADDDSKLEALMRNQTVRQHATSIDCSDGGLWLKFEFPGKEV